MTERQEEPDASQVNFTPKQAQEALGDDTELKVVTLRKGEKAALSPGADLPFNDLNTLGGVSDTGRAVTLEDIEKAMVERIEEARAKGLIPQIGKGSSEIQ
jgi:hypothetical protein